MPFDYQEILDEIRQKASSAARQVEEAQKRLEQAQTVQKFWASLVAELAADHPAQAVLLMRQSDDYLTHLWNSRDPLYPSLEALRNSLEQRARAGVGRFGREFPAAIREAGEEIDSTSRHPRYTFKQGFLRLEVDERDLTARLSPRDGKQILLGLDVVPIVAAVKAEIGRLFDRELQSEGLLRSIYTAYAAALRAEGRNEGEEVPLRRITNRLEKNLNRFSADEFNVDLARLIHSGSLVISNKRMHLNHTRNSRQGMLLHGLEDGGYVGLISFKGEGSQ